MAATTTTNEHIAAWQESKTYLFSRFAVKDDNYTETFDIPVIDLGLLSSDISADRLAVVEKLRSACVCSGFFVITSHGIDISACEGVLLQAERLLRDTPREQKECLHVRHSSHGYGWEPSNATSIAGDVETKEAFNWSYEDRLDALGGDGRYVQLDGTRATDVNLWPADDLLPGFFDAIRAYYSQALQLARELCRLFASSLDLPPDYFGPMITHPSANARLMYYPESSCASREDRVGLGAHTDYQIFTILLCSSNPGLEILSPTGQWIEAPTIKGGLIINIGDMMMRWTNGLYKSTVHRVVNRTGEERYSVPLFFGVNNDQIVETLPSCVDDANPSQFPPIRAGEYILQRLAMTLANGKTT